MIALALTLTLAAAPPAASSSSTTKEAERAQAYGEFGPFDAGAARPVVRQNVKGQARKQHPAVGALGHIPGGGPPPPALRTDPDVPEMASSSPNATPGLSANPLYLASLFYSHFLTRTDGPRCQHLPTCSRFAAQAVGRHGALGIPMGLDRMIQPGSSSAVRLLPDIEFGGVLRHYDPVDNYEFWRPELFTGFPLLVDEQGLPLPKLRLEEGGSDADPPPVPLPNLPPPAPLEDPASAP